MQSATDGVEVTLEKIDEPGEWEVIGKRVKRRLYTVSVSYRP